MGMGIKSLHSVEFLYCMFCLHLVNSVRTEIEGCRDACTCTHIHHMMLWPNHGGDIARPRLGICCLTRVRCSF